MVKDIGLEETVGELIGENMDSLELKWEVITWELKLIAAGLFLLMLKHLQLLLEIYKLITIDNTI